MRQSEACMRQLQQLTLRGFDKALAERVVRFAREQGLSLNKAAMALLRRAVGLEEGAESPGRVGSSLDELIGSWSAEEERELLDAVDHFGKVDEELWS